MTTDLPIEVSRISTSWVEVEQVKETLILQEQRQETVSMFLKTLSKVISLIRRILMKTRQKCQESIDTLSALQNISNIITNEHFLMKNVISMNITDDFIKKERCKQLKLFVDGNNL